jgi:anti-anti-sigma regulatory factor
MSVLVSLDPDHHGRRSPAIPGRLDCHRASGLRAELLSDAQMLEGLSLDLSDTTFIDMAGIEMLSELGDELGAQGLSFDVGAVSQPVQVILELTRRAGSIDRPDLVVASP